ncbi:MAG TPA: phospho-sugar mutase [Thermotogota bacterium]|nr:phospho-sugar mutase [Thermotogota bacterium]
MFPREIQQKNFQEWLERSTGWVHDELAALQDLPPLQREQAVEERFSMEADFGTGGLRAKLRAGTNGFNDPWVIRISLALSQQAHSVVIAFDTRNRSEYFARLVAKTFRGQGKEVYLFSSPVPTPVLSFSVPALGCEAGVMITASHNPAVYNGYKTYDSRGVQMVPTQVSQLKAKLEAIDFFAETTLDDEGIHFLDERWYDNYFSAIFREMQPLRPHGEEDVDVLYSALHGTGAHFVPVAVRWAGARVSVVEKQSVPDPFFSTVPVPNPEDPGVFQLALEQIARTSAPSSLPEMILATDPDADRLGALFRQNGNYVSRNGNELGILLLDFLLQNLPPERTRNAVVLKTIVTSDMVFPLAQKWGFQVQQTLTGFKFLGDLAWQLRQKGKEVLFCFEESYGYLFGPHAGDKDAVSSAALLACMLRFHGGAHGVLKHLQQLKQEHGFFGEQQLSFTREGTSGLVQIARFMEKLRESPLDSLAQRPRTRMVDYLRSPPPLNGDMVELAFGNALKVVFRPSGTEPKLKLYLSSRGETEENSQLLAKSAQSELMAWIQHNEQSR